MQQNSGNNNNQSTPIRRPVASWQQQMNATSNNTLNSQQLTGLVGHQSSASSTTSSSSYNSSINFSIGGVNNSIGQQQQAPSAILQRRGQQQQQHVLYQAANLNNNNNFDTPTALTAYTSSCSTTSSTTTTTSTASSASSSTTTSGPSSFRSISSATSGCLGGLASSGSNSLMTTTTNASDKMDSNNITQFASAGPRVAGSHINPTMSKGVGASGASGASGITTTTNVSSSTCSGNNNSNNSSNNNNNSGTSNNTQPVIDLTLTNQAILTSLSEEESRKLRLQLYVFVLRCISYPFNAKQGELNQQRHQQAKLKLNQLEQIIQLHNRYLQLANRQSTTTSQLSAGTGAGAATNEQFTTSTTRSHPPQANTPTVQWAGLTGNQQRQLDELWLSSNEEFNRKFLTTERMRLLVESQCCSQSDLRDLFRACVERQLSKCSLFAAELQHHHQRTSHHHHSTTSAASTSSTTTSATTLSRTSSSNKQQQPSRHQQVWSPTSAGSGADGSNSPTNFYTGPNNVQQQLPSKEALISSWLIKFEQILRGEESTTTTIGQDVSSKQHHQTTINQTTNQGQLTKEQLYQMFQAILIIKKFEHQLLYNALQLDSSDEQAAAIRRELDGRIAKITEIERNKSMCPKFVLKDMEQLYFEELRYAVNRLMINLDSLPVMKSSGALPSVLGAVSSAGSGHHSTSGLGAGSGGDASASGLALTSSSGTGSGGGQQSSSSSRVSYGLQKFRRYNSRFVLKIQANAALCFS